MEKYVEMIAIGVVVTLIVRQIVNSGSPQQSIEQPVQYWA